MLRLLKNRRLWIAAVVVGGLLVVAFWPSTVIVDMAAVMRGSLIVTIDEEGTTRVRDRFVVSAPVAGRVLRIELEPGDQVKRGSLVASVRAEMAPLLDPRSRAEGQAAIEAARASLGRARAEAQRARAALSLAERELARVRQLANDGLTSAQSLEAREAEVNTAEETVHAADFAVRAASSELQRAEARLAPSTPDQSGRVFTVTAPADGVVLKRLHESESVVPAGEALIEIGNPNQLEIVSDLLSTDAVRVRPGARAFIEQWGGDQALEAKVRRVEPSGFTKISALGVEEQRVNVLLDFVEPATAWAALGDAYRVEVRIVTWEAEQVLKVPTGALFRRGSDWAVYVVENGRARATVVSIGHQTGREAEVVSGLNEGDTVVMHPGDSLTDEVRVQARAEAGR
jgi:HlyD family secretion protein